MTISNQIIAQALNLALQQCDKLEAGLAKAVQDLKALKDGDLRLDQLVVSDNGWEFIPDPPQPEAQPFRPEPNGAKAKEAVSAGD